ncbi:pentatricopeptide repeat-containing protein At1g79540 [Prosopis cineraria]|uniref:pentatricopeptide repeat-containing protein At1g79540 n=1 Tax=Prosopis cineraria TaxID=364024 RepID=UPI00240F5166|nr:pentatricopeptide repeat-containing protein At1g79540 [Prosopis cineraria]XP_054780380.1 pentatricopeptide repeat-containing protein At1g79540 [Prosopis cineraria]XP_054780381.1 pentatricopeptide repeat-containing protein At1g79540 [Prosopis cineraria]XP_054780382.1 pentatricopeptide repeat-containing protein At1g79540 [Prosopis cineraria]XP_054780383.1 pentatricopeptide repeat-containing protein At1g79540 [Prosopis cineraria]XP_054780384.1 pentatricopeptide repeat-containing protein At1g79
MLTLSKLRKIFEIPWGPSVCHRQNHRTLRETKWLSLSCPENDLYQPNRFSRMDNPTTLKQPDLRMGTCLCILFALKAESLRSRPSLNLVCDTISRNNWFSLYFEALEQLRTSRVLVTSEAYRILLRTYLGQGMVERALAVFCRMRELDFEFDAHTYNTIIKSLLQKEMYLLVFALYNLMIKLNCCPDDYTYSLLIDGFCKCGRSDEVIEILEDMDNSNIRPNVITFTSILSGLCQGKKVDYAYRLFNKVKGNWFQPDLMIYSVLLDGFCKLGRFDEALSMVRLLKMDGFALGVDNYSCIIDGLFKARRYREAYSWYAKMFKEGIMPDIVLYTIMIHGLSKEGRVGEAIKLLDEIVQSGLTPDAYCYNAAIKGFCDIGLLDRALSLQLEISEHDQFPNTCTYSILICRMCKDGMVGEAQQIFNQMEKLGCLPSIVTFNSLIDGLCKAGQLEEARLLFCKMEIGKNPLLFLRLSQGGNRVVDGIGLRKTVEQMCESGQILNAYQLLIDSGVAPDISTYNILINAYCKVGNVDRALKLFEHLKLKGLSPDSVTYGTLIDGLYKADREEDALKLCEQMLEEGGEHSSSVYKALMTWFCRKKKVSLAFSVWLKYLNNLPGRVDDSTKVLEEYFNGGQVEKAIRRLLELDFKFKDFNLAPYTILLIGLCQAKRVREALIIFSVLDEFNININPPSCVHLIKGLCNIGKLGKAVDVFHYALDKGFVLGRQIHNRLLMLLLCSRTDKEYAAALVKRMESLGYTLHRYHSKKVRSLLLHYWGQQLKYRRHQADYLRREWKART